MAPGGDTWQPDALGRDQRSVKSACNSGWTMRALTERSRVNECLRLTFYFEHAAFGRSEASPGMTCKVMSGEPTAELLLGLQTPKRSSQAANPKSVRLRVHSQPALRVIRSQRRGFHRGLPVKRRKTEVMWCATIQQLSLRASVSGQKLLQTPWRRFWLRSTAINELIVIILLTVCELCTQKKNPFVLT